MALWLRDDCPVRIKVGDINLYFDVDGAVLTPQGDAMIERPTMLLLHGGPGADHSLFKPEFAALSDVAQIVYLDQRGSGRSDTGSPATWNWQQWAHDVAAFCRTLDIPRPVLVGTSSGALVALKCAARHPDLVAGLILDSPLGVPTSLAETLEVFERRGGPLARDAAHRYLSGDTSDQATTAWKTHALPLYGDAAAQADMEKRRARARLNDDVLTHFRSGACGPAEATGFLPAIACPTLILAGEHDPVVPAAATRRFAALFTNATTTLEILPGIGHGTFRQATQQAFTHVRNFIAHANVSRDGSLRPGSVTRTVVAH
jgi:pimeloyl-ACP methyl ester carboxylesterase